MLSRILLATVFLFGAGCTKSQPASSSLTPQEIEHEKLLSKGKGIYQSACIVCHNPDPTKDGSVGPAIAGSSEELVRLRILEGNYPTGYQPKRSTRVMPQFPQYKDDVAAIAIYLNSAK